MSRKKTEINPKRAERIKEICKREHITQTKLAKAIGMTQQNLSRIMTLKNCVTDLTIDRICEIYPLYRKSWLRGDDDYMTNAALLANVFNNGYKESELLTAALSAFVKLGEYHVEMSPIYDTYDVDTALKNMKEFLTISKDGKSITFSVQELNAFENELFDYFEFRLQHIMK